MKNLRTSLFALVVAVQAMSAAAETRISAWVHAGPGPERSVYTASVKDFNDKHKDIQIDLVPLPEGSYNDQVSAAALARKLPCLLDFDGPNVYNYSWTGKIIALDRFAEIMKIRADLLPTLQQQGTYNGKLYSLGQYDSGLAIWGNRKLLEKAKVRIPAGIQDAWDMNELEANLKKLKDAGVATPLDMKFNYGIGEWLTYGFSPILQSFGGDLINRKDFHSAAGVLNSAESVKALQTLQAWSKKGYINPATKLDSDFAEGRSALSYVGHWAYGGYHKALGNDLVLIPMPKFGARAVTGAGSWNWGISSDCKSPDAAAQVLGFLMSTEQILKVTDVNGAVPGTRTALAAAKAYAPDGALHIYADQSANGIALVRPQTPAYPVITNAFAEALNNVLGGSDVKAELDKAVKKIDQAIEDNRGYPVRNK